MQTRRMILASSTGVAALALGGLGFRAWDRGVLSGGDGPAYAPWKDWQGNIADGLKRPLRAAILAANPHDTQPWLFQMGDNAITLFADRARNLGAFDPFRREMYLGLGAAVENLVLSARAFGFAAKVAPTPGTLCFSPDDTPVAAAHIALTPTPAACDALFQAIPRRHTNRGPYRPDQIIGAEILRRLADLATDDTVRIVFVEDKKARSDLGALIVEATSRIIGDPQMSADSPRWFRTGRREIAASADRYWLSSTRETQVSTAPVFGMLLVRDRLDAASALQAGRAWQRLHLAATAEGLAAQPLNQPVECIDRDAMLGRADTFGSEIAKFGGAPSWEPTFVFRLGVAEHAAKPSTRRPLEQLLRMAAV